MKNKHLICAYLGFWFLVNLFILIKFPGDIDGDEPWLSNAAHTMIKTGNARNTIFPLTSLNEGYGLTTPWLYYIILGSTLKIFGINIIIARITSLISGLIVLIITYFISKKVLKGKDSIFAVVLLSLNIPFLFAIWKTRPDIYSVLFFSAILFCCLLEKYQIAAILAGLGWGIHPNVLFLGAGGLLFVLLLKRGKRPFFKCFGFMAAAFLFAFLISGIFGGFNFGTFRDVHAGYKPQFLNFLSKPSWHFFIRMFARKTYYIEWLSLKYPLLTVCLFLSAFSVFIKKFQFPKTIVYFGMGIFLAFSIFVPTSRIYYFVYYAPFVAIGAGYTISKMPKMKGPLLIFVLAAAFWELSTLNYATLPRETYQNVQKLIPDDVSLWAFDTYWFAKPNTKFYEPLFLDDPKYASEFKRIVFSIGADYVIARKNDDPELRKIAETWGEKIFSNADIECFKLAVNRRTTSPIK